MLVFYTCKIQCNLINKKQNGLEQSKNEKFPWYLPCKEDIKLNEAKISRLHITAQYADCSFRFRIKLLVSNTCRSLD